MNTNLAVAQFRTTVRAATSLDDEFVVWEPETQYECSLARTGMEVVEHDSFGKFQAPIPADTDEAVQRGDLAKQDDKTKIWSIRFVGKQLVYCPEYTSLGTSLVERLNEIWESSSRNMMGEYVGGFDYGRESKTVLAKSKQVGQTRLISRSAVGLDPVIDLHDAIGRMTDANPFYHMWQSRECSIDIETDIRGTITPLISMAFDSRSLCSPSRNWLTTREPSDWSL